MVFLANREATGKECDRRSMIYAIGDIQGCLASLNSLLAAIPAEASLRFVGDLVNRGPSSLETLRQVKKLCDSGRARTVLGNHDIHLLAVAAGVRAVGRRDTIGEVLVAKDCEELIDWRRQQPLAIYESGFLTVHAGVLPQWTLEVVLELANLVERELRGPRWRAFLAEAFGNAPARWSQSVVGIERLRLTINALTRLRFCTPDGTMEFETKDSDGAPAGYVPWFDAPHRCTQGTPIVFGHWSTRGLIVRDDLLGLDTGCVWGGMLTAARVTAVPAERTVIQVACEKAQNVTATKPASC